MIEGECLFIMMGGGHSHQKSEDSQPKMEEMRRFAFCWGNRSWSSLSSLVKSCVGDRL